MKLDKISPISPTCVITSLQAMETGVEDSDCEVFEDSVKSEEGEGDGVRERRERGDRPSSSSSSRRSSYNDGECVMAEGEGGSVPVSV